MYLRDANWARLQAVDIKVGEWELSGDEGDYWRNDRYILACRLAAGFRWRLNTTFIPARKPLMFDENDQYDHALASVGL